jgi:flagellar hook protein FlgE
VYSGDAVADFIELALGEANYDVSYDSVTNRFSIENENATTAQIFWEDSGTTAGATLGFTDNDTIAQNDAVTSDNGVAFNIIADQNDDFAIIVDGNPQNSGTAVTVTIDSGAYTGDSLAAELQDKINVALAAEGESVTAVVTYNEASGRMRIASSTLGADSSIQLGSTGMGTQELLGGTLNIDDDTINYGMGLQISAPDDSSNYSTSIVVYDSLGNQHTVNFYFRKAAVADDMQSTTWEWFAYVPASETASGEAEVQARGTLTFNEQGILAGQSPTQWLTTQPDGSDGEGFDFGTGAEPQQDIDIDFGLNNNVNLSTQYASPSSTIFQSQDGFGSGFLESVSVDPDGVISGNYSNGQVLFLARVSLANFTNPWGLSRVGGNVWAETRNSGQPLTGTPGSAGLGKIAPNSLEQSNVDLSAEFVNMIIQQRGFQANSRIITTTDAMLSELINLKR